jgi:hypothetical protein
MVVKFSSNRSLQGRIIESWFPFEIDMHLLLIKLFTSLSHYRDYQTTLTREYLATLLPASPPWRYGNQTSVGDVTIDHHHVGVSRDRFVGHDVHLQLQSMTNDQQRTSNPRQSVNRGR